MAGQCQVTGGSGTRKAVVLARGLGKRMREPAPGVSLSPQAEQAAACGMKALMPINGRPFLDYIADSLFRAGLRDICLVVPPGAQELRRHAARIAQAAGAAIHCAVQPEARGTADAVLAAEEFVGGEPFVLCNGDNLYPDSALRRLSALGDASCWMVAFESQALMRRGNIRPERLRSLAVATVSGQGCLVDIVEKPGDPSRYAHGGRLWVNMNLYRFTPRVFEACRRVQPDPLRGELELTSAVQWLARSASGPVRVILCEEGVLDLTTRADVAAVERSLKERALCF